MKVLEEKTFPRGGKKPILGDTHKIKRAFIPGETAKRKKSGIFKEKHKKTENEDSVDSDVDYMKLAEDLDPKKDTHKPKATIRIITNKTISEGLVVLGCIGDISEFELKVNLPGRIIGYVPISNISEHYTNSVKNILRGQQEEPRKLEEIFKIGQFVITKVENVERIEGKRNKLTLTLDPSKIHSDWSSKSIKKGLVLSATVRSVEDHGYVMDFGIADVRAFLKKQKTTEYEKVWNDGQQLVIGQVIRCLVTKSKVNDNYTNVELTADPRTVATATLDEISLNTIVPGMLFDLEVSEVSLSGLVVKFADDMTGFVHEDYLNTVNKVLNKIGEGHHFKGRVLYVEPYTKHIHFTLRKRICDAEPAPALPLQRGSIVTKAKVIKVKGTVLFLKLHEEPSLHGVVTSRHLNKVIEADTETSQEKQLSKLHPVGSHVKCRVLGYDSMLQVFSCSLEKAILNQPYISPADCKIGDVVECVITKAAPRNIKVSIGSVNGIVDPLHYDDFPVANPEVTFPVNRVVKGKVLKVLKTAVELTLRPSLVNSTNPVLKDYNEAELDKDYDGVVVLVKRTGCLVRFYGEVAGWLRRSDFFINETPQVGQAVTCNVVYSELDEGRMLVRLTKRKLEEPVKSRFLNVGLFYMVNVTDIMTDGLVVIVEDKSVKGIIPAQQLSDTKGMGFMLLRTYKKGDTLRACCVNAGENPIFSISLSIMEFYESKIGKKIASNGKEAVNQFVPVPSLIMQITPQAVLVDVAVPCMHPAWILKKNISEKKFDDIAAYGLEMYQTLFIKMLYINLDSYSFASSKLSKVWNGDFQMGINLLQNYLAENSRVISHLKESGDPLAKLHPGEEVVGRVLSLSEEGAVKLRLMNGADGYIAPQHVEDIELNEDMIVKGMVMLVNTLHNYAEITLRKDTKELLRRSLNNPLDFKYLNIENRFKGQIIVIKPNFMLVCLGINDLKLAYSPVQWHVNDTASKEVVRPHEHYILKAVKDERSANNLCIPLQMDPKAVAYDKMEAEEMNDRRKRALNVRDKDEVKSKKKKKFESKTKKETLEEAVLSPKVTKEKEMGIDSNRKERKKVKKILCTGNKKEAGTVQKEECRKRKQKSSDNSMKPHLNSEEVVLPCLSVDARFVWDAKPEHLQNLVLNGNADPSSSDDEDDGEKEKESLNTKKKKKRLSAAEKKALAREADERLRQVELRLMDAEKNPQSADDFDRLVMSVPNNSQYWIKYMAFHLQATEIEKARAVGQRALQAISFREEQEKLNVWMALLNLENLYGTKETFDKTLQDAVQLNDGYKVHMQVVQMYADTGKIVELDKIIQLVTKKYKEQKDTWIRLGEVYLKLGNLDKARFIMQRALSCLDKREHIEFITRFARLENDFGESERAETLMENILTSYPKRVDVWCVYIDMLVKSKKMDLARQALERSVVQQLPPAKMKTIYKKFLRFEQDHGTPDAVEKVRRKAKEYVESTMKDLID